MSEVYFVFLVLALFISGHSCNANSNGTNLTTSEAATTTSTAVAIETTSDAVVVTTKGMTTTNSADPSTATIKDREGEVTAPDNVCNVSSVPYGFTPKSGTVGTAVTGARNDTMSSYARVRTCDVTVTCSANGKWNIAYNNCGQYTCIVKGVWGPNCTRACGGGCTNKSCNTDGLCTDPTTGTVVQGCNAGYTGEKCNLPVCEGNCNGGTCLAPNYCGNCPKHFEAGPYCRNIRADGVVRGALPSLLVLSIIVTALSLGSKFYMRNKIKEI